MTLTQDGLLGMGKLSRVEVDPDDLPESLDCPLIGLPVWRLL